MNKYLILFDPNVDPDKQTAEEPMSFGREWRIAEGETEHEAVGKLTGDYCFGLGEVVLVEPLGELSIHRCAAIQFDAIVPDR